MKINFLRLALPLIFILLICNSNAFAQTTENVFDAYVFYNGGRVSGATVTLWQNGQIVNIQNNPRLTDKDGHFIFQHLVSGNYTITAEKDGHKGHFPITFTNTSNTIFYTSIDLDYNAPIHITANSYNVSSIITAGSALFENDNIRKNIFKIFSIFIAIFAGILTNILSASSWFNNLIEPISKKIYDLFFNFFKSFFGANLSKHTSVKEKKRPLRRKMAKVGVEFFIICISAFFIGLAFFVANRAPLSLDYIVLYILVAGCAIVLHDLAHRITAALYKKDAEYKFWGLGTLSMFLTAILCGFVFCQPARTVIFKNDMSTNKNNGVTPVDEMNIKAKNESIKNKHTEGIIFLSGPVVSLSIAAIFIFMVPIAQVIKMTFNLQPIDFHGLETYFTTIGKTGFMISLLMGVYSLMPFEPMDGSRVLKWKRSIWALIFIPSFLLYMIILYISP